MKFLGLNLGRTKSGLSINDGGVCVFSEGEVAFAVAEERISRAKHDGGFRNALEYALRQTGTALDDIDRVGVTNYGDRPIDDYAELLEIDNQAGVFEADQVAFVPSHHLAHAYAAYWPAPFERALVTVMDNEGTIIGERTHENHWENRMERVSHYVADGDRVELLERDLDGPGTPSLGEVYGNFTEFLGFDSYLDAGKTMGLSSYGDAERFADYDLFSIDDGSISVHLEGDYTDPVGGIRRFARRTGIELGEPRGDGEPFTQRHRDIAAWVQRELETVVLDKLEYLHEQTGIDTLCLAGGVAYNCVLNQRILGESPIEQLFIQPAAGDQGLALGVCYYLYDSHGGARDVTPGYDTYLGGRYGEDEIRRTLDRQDVTYVRHDDATLVERAAESLANGDVIAWYQGRSEMGPRALGNRSILADPRDQEMVDTVNADVKHREGFRPFAPSVLASAAETYFAFEASELPYMIVTADAKEPAIEAAPAVVHVDDTSRIQTVSKADNRRYHRLISAFADRTGVPLLLNTSFNLAGEPIVETPFDALYTFRATNIDVLYAGNFEVRK